LVVYWSSFLFVIRFPFSVFHLSLFIFIFYLLAGRHINDKWKMENDFFA